MSVNKVILVGRLGRDPESRFTNSGKQVVNFTIATDETFKDRQGQKQKVTEWHRLVAWGKVAEIVQEHVKKGDLIYVEGKLQTRSYEDKKTGETKYTTEINVNTIRMLGGNGGSKRETEPETETVGEESGF